MLWLLEYCIFFVPRLVRILRPIVLARCFIVTFYIEAYHMCKQLTNSGETTDLNV